MKTVGFISKRFIVFALSVLALFTLSTKLNAQQQDFSKEITKVIYTTDLWTPAGDPDDHFDILTLMSLDDVQIPLVVIDNTMKAHVERKKVNKGPNCNAVRKAAKVFGKGAISCKDGLLQPLKSEIDQGLDQKKELQEGVELMLKELERAADNSVVIITVGSLRDVAAAFNRNKDIFHTKVKRLIVSIGDSYGYEKTKDANTAKDVLAWKRIMTSGLPIDWMPTNPFSRRGGPSKYCSHWYFMQLELLETCPDKVKEFMKSEGIGPYDFMSRNMWSTPAFVEISGKKSYRENNEIKWLDPAKASPSAKLLESYVFVPISISLDSENVAEWKETKDVESNIRIFRIEDYYMYNEVMFQFLKKQFNEVAE